MSVTLRITETPRLEGLNLIIRISPSDLPEVRKFIYKFVAGVYEIIKTKQKRSLDANAYAWVLITKIGDALGRSKDDVYLDMLKRYGQTGIAKIPNESAELFKRQWKYVEEHEKLPSEERAQYFRFWVGSSHYSVSEMSAFIDGIVSEAKDLDIETLTPSELERMKADWK